ncbi:MAG: hypothetical protein NHF97_00925, partial [Flavobacteriia bacterium]|nr:hypothetical protein [Candidatus Bostrichicola ureolyticus]
LKEFPKIILALLISFLILFSINAFNDLMIENLKTKSKHKIDILIEEYIENKIKKEINNAKIILGNSFNEEYFIKNNTNIIA